MKKIFTLMIALVASVGMLHSEIFKVGDLYYKDSIRARFVPPTKILYDTIFLGLTSSPEYDRYAGDIVIPSSIEYNGHTYDITSIADEVFANCVDLKSVTIPNSVTYMGNRVFFNCSNLKSVNIPDSVTNIGNQNFEGCTALTSIKIPNAITVIGKSAFNCCGSLTSIEIPNSVTSIGKRAFSSCNGLTTITIPNSVTYIGEGALMSCCGMTSIQVAEENMYFCSVEGVLFNKEMTKLIQYPSGKQGAYCIPNNVESIGYSAFYNDTLLTSISIPTSVKSMDDYAFACCNGLASITCEAVAYPTLGKSAFEYVNKSIPLYVPEESISAYQAADQWKDFTNIQAISTTGIDQITNTKSPIINKAIRNGQIIILRDDRTYTLTGQEVK